MRIPNKFKLFGTTYDVVFENENLNDAKSYGDCNYSKSLIRLSTTHGVHSLSKDRILDTFYHERTHAILDMMNERDLSNDEKFVDVFSKLLRQAIETEEY